MFDDEIVPDTKDTGEEKQVAKPLDTSEIEKWLFTKKDVDDFFCCLIYGKDGSGKSGIVQSFPLGKDETMVILDLDGGNTPLLRYNKGKNIIVKNPLTTAITEDGVIIDYVASMNKIKSTVNYIRNNYKKKNITVFCLDGLSTLDRKSVV